MVKGLSESVQVYVARIRRVCADLLNLGVKVSDDEVTPALLAGLPSADDMMVTVIESSEDALSLEVVTKLLNTEARVPGEAKAEANIVTRSPRAHPRQQQRMETRTCHHCGKKGHLRRDCRQRIQAEQSGSQAAALMAGLGALPSSCEWTVDSGASHHLRSSRCLLHDLRESHVKSVTTANHGAARVLGVGDVQLCLTVCGTRTHVGLLSS
jgi:hypothetical protein